MTIVLVTRTGHRMLLDIEKPELVIRVRSTSTQVDYDLQSVDHQNRMVYVERKPQQVMS